MNKKNHVNNYEMDRALGLKFGSWDTDKSPEMKALKKIVEKFPWIVKVADRDYDREYADAALLEAVVKGIGADGIAEILKGYRGIDDDEDNEGDGKGSKG